MAEPADRGDRPEPPAGRVPFVPKPILEKLVEHGVDFVVIGGLAGMAHGSSYPSYDVDVAYSRDWENLERLAALMRELGVTLRGAPPDLPFQRDARALANGANFTFDTPLGPLDILADPAGIRSYDALRAAAIETPIDGVTVPVASLDHLIAMKRAAGREKDKRMITEYIALADEQSGNRSERDSRRDG